MPTVGNVIAGKPLVAGACWSAPLGTALPTETLAALNVAFVSAGYIGDAGITQSIGRTTSTVKAWGGDTVKTLQTDFSATFQYTLIESLNPQVSKEVFGVSNVTVTAKSGSVGALQAIAVNATSLPHLERVYQMKDGLATTRLVLPDSQIIAVGDITYSDDSVVAYPVTVQAYPDGSGNPFYIYTNDGIFP